MRSTFASLLTDDKHPLIVSTARRDCSNRAVQPYWPSEAAGLNGPPFRLMPEQELLRVDQRPVDVLPRPPPILRHRDVLQQRLHLVLRRQPRQRRQVQLVQDRPVAQGL